ncbi:MAG: hypothetical protein IJ461_02380 [Clostridia bacterium]|nr:hypothetical protein [Clostridia bacterium]
MNLKGWWERLGGTKHGPWLIAAVIILTLLSLTWTEPAATNGASQQEMRMAQVLSQIHGAGKVEVAVYYPQAEASSLWENQELAAPTGAVIVAQGGNDIAVRLQLIRAASTLLGLEGDQICVFPMDEGGV